MPKFSKIVAPSLLAFQRLNYASMPMIRLLLSFSSNLNKSPSSCTGVSDTTELSSHLHASICNFIIFSWKSESYYYTNKLSDIEYTNKHL